MRYSNRPPLAGDCLAGNDMKDEYERLQPEPLPEWTKNKNEPCLCTASHFTLETHPLPSDGVVWLVQCCRHKWVNHLEG